MKNNSLPALLIVTALVIAAGAYWYFFVDSGNQQPLTPNTSVNEAQTRFQALVGELQPISFDTGIFSDARFNVLVDLTTSITPEPSGRSDPFAPATAAGVSTSSSASLMSGTKNRGI